MNSQDLANHIKDTAIAMNKVAAEQYRNHWGMYKQKVPELCALCAECGDEITGISYNGRCGPCNQQINREEATFSQKQWEEMNRE